MMRTGTPEVPEEEPGPTRRRASRSATVGVRPPSGYEPAQLSSTRAAPWATARDAECGEKTGTSRGYDMSFCNGVKLRSMVDEGWLLALCASFV